MSYLFFVLVLVFFVHETNSYTVWSSSKQAEVMFKPATTGRPVSRLAALFNKGHKDLAAENTAVYQWPEDDWSYRQGWYLVPRLTPVPGRILHRKLDSSASSKSAGSGNSGKPGNIYHNQKHQNYQKKLSGGQGLLQDDAGAIGRSQSVATSPSATHVPIMTPKCSINLNIIGSRNEDGSENVPKIDIVRREPPEVPQRRFKDWIVIEKARPKVSLFAFL